MRTNFYTRWTNKYWKFATILEISKFSLYLIVPIATSIIYTNPVYMHALITNLNLVQYPESEVKQSKEIKDEVFKLKKKMEELKQQKKETTKNS